MKLGLVMMLCGCGRIAFEARIDASDPDDDGTVDVAGVGTWPVFLTTPQTATAKRAVIGPNGDVYITGQATGALTIDGFTHAAIGSGDLLVARFAPDGTRIWSRVYGGTGPVDGRDIAFDSLFDRVGVHGQSAGVAMYESQLHDAAGDADPITLYHDASGQLVGEGWYASTNANADGRGLAVAPGGDIVTGGTFDGALDIDGVNVSDQPGTQAYVARRGDSPFTITFASSANYVSVTDVDLGSDAAGACAGGDFTGTTDFNGTMVTVAGAQDGYVANIGAGGVVQSVGRIGSTGGDGVLAVAEVDTDCIAVGSAAAGIDFGAGIQTPRGSIDGFVVRYGPNGAIRWFHVLGGSTFDDAWGVAVDAAGTVFVAGTFTGTANFAGMSATSAGGTDGYVLQLGSGGTFMNLTTFGGPEDEYVWGVAADSASRSVVVIGDFLRGADIGGKSIRQPAGGYVHRFTY